MKMADLLHSIADMLDQVQTDDGAGEQQQAHLEPVEVDRTSTDQVDSGHMIPPLQQKLELLKKATGVPSAFDGQGEEQHDELGDIKKMAGLHTAVEDEPFDD